jgi:hypothetical protein
MISAASTAGAGRLSGSSRLSSLEPEDVEVRLVAGDQLVIGEGPEALALLARLPVAGPVAGDDVVQVLAAQRALFQRKALVGAEVVDPKRLVQGVSLAGFLSKSSTFALTPGR